MRYLILTIIKYVWKVGDRRSDIENEAAGRKVRSPGRQTYRNRKRGGRVVGAKSRAKDPPKSKTRMMGGNRKRGCRVEVRSPCRLFYSLLLPLNIYGHICVLLKNPHCLTGNVKDL